MRVVYVSLTPALPPARLPGERSPTPATPKNSSKAFDIQQSADGGTWTTAYQTTAGPGGRQTLAVSGTARYIRIDLSQRTARRS
jgi:hypothetical protein